MAIYRRFWLLGLVGAMVAIAPPTARAQEDVREVTVYGDGLSRDEAIKDALRRALEEGGRVEISSHSQVENFELIRDSIYARSEGIVTDYKVLGCSEGVGGVTRCEIRARVSKSAIASNWGEVQNVLDQLGRPGIAIYILERIDGVIQDSSILESRLENRLLEKGFVVYAGQQLRAIADKEGTDAAAEGNMSKVQAIAKDFGTQIYIEGTAQANAAGVKDLYGEPAAMYNGDAMIKMFYTDTGQLIASEPLPNWRGGARGYREKSPQAGKKALDLAGEELVERLFQNVMRSWATRISYGGELELEVEGINMVQAIKIKKKLRDIPNVERVNGPSMTKGKAKFRILAKMSAETLVEYLVTDDWLELIEVIDLKANRIQAKAP